MFWTCWRSHGSLDEGLVLIHTSMVNDGVRIHGVKHLLPGSILLGFSLVELRICWSISISSGHRCSIIDQLGEGSSADETILIGVCIHKQLQERMVHLGVRVTLLVVDCLLDEPDEVLLGLVEGVHW